MANLQYTPEQMEAAITPKHEYLNGASVCTNPANYYEISYSSPPQSQMVVHFRFKKMLGVRLFAAMAENYPPLKEEQITAYHQSPTDRVSPEVLRLWSKCPYNVEAAITSSNTPRRRRLSREKLTFPERYKLLQDRLSSRRRPRRSHGRPAQQW